MYYSTFSTQNSDTLTGAFTYNLYIRKKELFNDYSFIQEIEPVFFVITRSWVTHQ